ncbi:MAG: DUF4179 domain-containing protein [Lachnospiraceae bacterium]|nr:DUF4179 domain-containing protein [Lachnospiraceae bacterium]
MKKEYIDSELYEILHFTPTITPKIQAKIDFAYEEIRNKNSASKAVPHHKEKIRSHIYSGFAAAILLAFGFIGFGNSALAAKIPFIGGIFNLVETKLSYPGNFSENSHENVYSQTVGDVTITLSEASYTEMALYFSLELYSEEGFPEDFNRVKNMEDYIRSYDVLNMQSSQSFDFSQADPNLYNNAILSASVEEGAYTPYSIEGNFADTHTFLGVIRIDLDAIKRAFDISSLPPEFTYTFTIRKFWGRLNETKEIKLTDPDTGKISTIMNAVQKYYEGPWSFTFPVSLDTAGTQTREIMETNKDGVGISTVTKTRYEIKADLILPEGANPVDYFVCITDVDGKILDSQGNNNAEIYSVYGRNTDTVYIYVVDYFTYMDECKAENAYLLPEKSLFMYKVEW